MAAYVGYSAAGGWSALDGETFERSVGFAGVWAFRTFQFGRAWDKSDELHVAVYGVERVLVDELATQARRFAVERGLLRADAQGVLRAGDHFTRADEMVAGAAREQGGGNMPKASPVTGRLGEVQVWGAIDKMTGLLGEHCERLAVGGSVRRGSSEPKDVELVVIPKPSLWPVLDGLVTAVALGKADYGGKTRWGQLYRGVDVGGVKVEIFTATEATWGYIYWLRTGPGAAGQYVVSRLWDSPVRAQDGAIWYAPDWQMVGKAWVSKRRQQVRVADERDFFGLLNMPYVEPAYRNEKVYRDALGGKGRTWGDPLPFLMDAPVVGAANLQTYLL